MVVLLVALLLCTILLPALPNSTPSRPGCRANAVPFTPFDSPLPLPAGGETTLPAWHAEETGKESATAAAARLEDVAGDPVSVRRRQRLASVVTAFCPAPSLVYTLCAILR